MVVLGVQRRGSTWLAHLLGTPSFGFRYLDHTCYIRCKNLALNMRDCVSLVGRGSSVIGTSIRKLCKFVYPTLHVSLKAVGPFYLASMPLPGEVKYPTQRGKCVTCRGLHVLNLSKPLLC